MPEIIESTLDEVNQQVKMRMFETLNYVCPTMWTDTRRLIYCPVDDLDYATMLFQEGMGTEATQSLQIPFAYFTRASGQAVGNTFDYARRPWAEWLSTGRDEIPRSDVQIKFIPAVFQYYLKVFDSFVKNTEAIIDHFLHKGIREKTKTYHYDSSVLGISSKYVIELGNPAYGRTPNLADRTSGKGRVFSINVPFQVYCALGEGVPVHRIEKVNVTEWYSPHIGPFGWLSSKMNISDRTELNSFVVDSNTPSYPPKDPNPFTGD